MSPLQYLKKRLTVFLLVTAACLAACGEAPQRGEPTIVVSVRPLALIAQEVVAGAPQPWSIHVLAENTDPHRYAPGMADRSAIEQSALVVWLGPQMESVLARQLAQVPAQRQLTLLEDGEFEFSAARADDGHIWLRPVNAARAAGQLAERLAQLDPAEADGYRKRAAEFSRSMAGLQAQVQRQLQPFREVPIVVGHDAFGHLLGPAGLQTQALGGAHAGHGARAMLELQQADGGCLFGEWPENDRDRQTAEHLGLRYAGLDLMGAGLAADATYPDLIERLLAQVQSCLAENVTQAE